MAKARLDGLEVDPGTYQLGCLRMTQLVQAKIVEAYGVAVANLLCRPPPALEVAGVEPLLGSVAADRGVFSV
jgi:hypothetical protein